MPTPSLPHNAACRSVWIIAVLVLFTACASRPKPLQQPPASRTENPVLNYALSLQGLPYAYGKASPAEGFDCSGFIWHVYRHHGILLPRTAVKMANALPAVPLDARRAGDLLFFATGDTPFSHVGLYLGDDAFIHAPSSHTSRIMVSGLGQPYWRTRLTAVRRPPAPANN